MFIKIFKRKHNYTITIWKKLHQYPTEDLATHRDARNHLCQREIHPKSLLKILHFFSKTLDSNPIGFYS
jgi:hypothetical protein